eukprot:TRINITY_DN1613_c0_g1_i2.p1 TRINITY_DN1613_c0_g1~~TRINITY_DN1613_c0_g1_i2.p1  ORF type:complete len:341 (+),score=38.77 TRINITY_DN1613_c0_g1_i2:249-1271(+)
MLATFPPVRPGSRGLISIPVRTASPHSRSRRASQEARRSPRRGSFLLLEPDGNALRSVSPTPVYMSQMPQPEVPRAPRLRLNRRRHHQSAAPTGVQSRRRSLILPVPARKHRAPAPPGPAEVPQLAAPPPKVVDIGTPSSTWRRLNVGDIYHESVHRLPRRHGMPIPRDAHQYKQTGKRPGRVGSKPAAGRRGKPTPPTEEQPPASPRTRKAEVLLETPIGKLVVCDTLSTRAEKLEIRAKQRGKEPSEADLNQMLGLWKHYDMDLNGEISLNEFIEAVGKLTPVLQQHAESMFCSFDRNGDGVLNFQEFFKVLTMNTSSECFQDELSVDVPTSNQRVHT